METRKAELLQLQSHIAEFDTELTEILQHLQWDRKNLVEDCPKVVCKYNVNHKIPQESKESHEAQCRLAHNGYSKEDKMLPDPLDQNAKTLVRLNNYNIQQIINQAVNTDPSFKKGTDNVEIEPQTLDRLQSTYTGDERRAIYDAVVQAAPFCHDLSDLALLSEQGAEDTSKKQKSRVEILAELRDMKRRRTKYRVAAKTTNYSDVLRDVIKTQMEVYSHVKVEKPDAISSKEKPRDDKRNEQNRSFRMDSVRTSEQNRNDHKKHNREQTRSRYNEDRPTSKKTEYDEVDSSSKYRSHSDRKYNDGKEERDRYLSKDRSRYDDRYDVNVEDQRENRSRKRYHEDSERSAKTSTNDYKKSSKDKYRSEEYSSTREHKKERHSHRSGRRSPSREHREEKQYNHRSDRYYSSRDQKEEKKRHRSERQSSNRELKEEQYELKSYYASYEYESVKDKKKYSEHRK
ncbi:U11/U12 small nuclear ribonucleoprotein 48 kDa protein-like isoform X1 [Ostrinia furnacalis]|uniref:U11/U12 small nuclear ribonucleoprotein 48 kDa protein-like isoform X1 n=1 Tax=Ostrinia furnacalis TaxID=93504 RepID=UPI00103EDA32|nr:U11/U12 small nuclear ribonucleoprotein 48 kDa protein-like isoform X1 [Ostrinia furnacalis]